MPSDVLKGYTVTFQCEFGTKGIIGERKWENRIISNKREAFQFAWEAAFVNGHAEVIGNNYQGEWYFDKQEDGKIEVTEM